MVNTNKLGIRWTRERGDIDTPFMLTIQDNVSLKERMEMTKYIQKHKIIRKNIENKKLFIILL